jgi:transposase
VVTPWQPAESVLVACRQLEQVTEQLLKQKTMGSNSLEALERQPVSSPLAQQRLPQTWQRLDDQVQALEAALLTLLETRFSQEMTLLRSIPGIGRKTAGLLLLFAGGFARLANYRQLLAKAGLSPRAYPCGTRVRGKVRLTKMGGGVIRGKLFLCRLAAIKFNAACKALYDRLVAKGKNGKVALLAVCNKLLQQACAIVQSGVPYQADFSAKLACTS